MTSLPQTPFHTRDLADLGISRAQLAKLVGDGEVRRVIRSIYARTDLDDTVELRAAAAQLVLPDHVVVCDRTAAWLHGVDAYVLGDLELGPNLDVVSIRGHDRTQRDGFLGGKRALRPEDICEVCGILTTTALRTACDLACLYGRSTALAVLDAFMRRHGLTREDFERVLPRFKRRRGVRQLRELVKLATPDAESPGESWTRLAIIDAGLPTPQPNQWVDVEGYGRVRLDLVYAGLKIAVEYDGEEFHTEAADQEHDRKRRTALRHNGWIVIVVRKEDLAGDRLAAWLAELREELRSRRPSTSRRYSRTDSADWPIRRRRRTAIH